MLPLLQGMPIQTMCKLKFLSNLTFKNFIAVKILKTDNETSSILDYVSIRVLKLSVKAKPFYNIKAS